MLHMCPSARFVKLLAYAVALLCAGTFAMPPHPATAQTATLDKEGLDAQPQDHAQMPETHPEDRGLGAITVKHIDEFTVASSAMARNDRDEAWSVTFELTINGRTVSFKTVTLAPNTKQLIVLDHRLTRPGIYRVSLGIVGVPGEVKEIASPSIALEGEWCFRPGDDLAWKDRKFDDTTWAKVQLPASWEEHSDYTPDPAYGWYRKAVIIPKKWKKRGLVLPLGKIDDADETFFNGQKIGGLGSFAPDGDTAQETPRRYKVPPRLIRYGKKNVIAIRVFDRVGTGGLTGGPLGPIEIQD